MNSLDDVFEQMRLFHQALREFDRELQQSATSLARAHEDLSGLWADAAADHYQQTYQPLAESLNTYLQTRAPRFERFLENKVRQLEQYLNGA